jgi:hypothetical protein
MNKEWPWKDFRQISLLSTHDQSVDPKKHSKSNMKHVEKGGEHSNFKTWQSRKGLNCHLVCRVLANLSARSAALQSTKLKNPGEGSEERRKLTFETFKSESRDHAINHLMKENLLFLWVNMWDFRNKLSFVMSPPRATLRSPRSIMVYFVSRYVAQSTLHHF